MKIRNGFVSNSSSSSFIITLPEKIYTYSLEEFRELLNDTNFDPVKQLYDDLMDKNSQRELSDFEKKRYGIDKLGSTQYLVEYGNECAFCGNMLGFEKQEIMEDFVPSIDDKSEGDITVRSFDNH